MHKITPRDTAGRAFHGAWRATVDSVDDRPLMQEMKGQGLHGDARDNTERWQSYGYTSVPLPRDKEKGGKSAEALMIAAGGSRSHPVAACIDDRRYRLQQLKPGEVALFDDQTQQVHLARDGVYVSVPPDKKFEVRVQKEGDKVKPAATGTGGASGSAGQGGQNQARPGKYGQTAWRDKAPYADHRIDKTARTVRHPKTVQHQVVAENDLAKVLHQTALTKTAGLLQSVQEGAQILRMLPTGGISLESVQKVAQKAPQILHDGPVSMLQTLAVTQGITAAGYTTSSSRSLKRDFRRPRHGLATLRRIRVTEYALKADPGRRILGFVAQQVRTHFDLAVSLVAGTRRKRLAVDHGQMLALAVASIQELSAEVDALRREVARLSRR